MVVVGEKSYKHIDEGPIRNVRRTRSPTAAAEDSSGSEEDDSGMRIGPEYQAEIPEFNPQAELEGKMEAMLVWAPHPDPAIDARIDEYSAEAKEKHGYNLEQSLGMLFWHKHSIEKAKADLPNFTPFPEDWTVEDRALFEQAFGFHGKCFHKIRQMLPDKSIGCLVKYYYSWKKTRSRTSLIDRQANKIANSRDVSDEEMEASGSSDSDNDTTKENMKEESKSTMSRAGIGNRKADLHAKMRSKRKPPRGMYLNQECLMSVATGPPGQGDTILKQYEVELVELKRQVQNNKQVLSSLKEKSFGAVDLFRIPEGVQKINGKWTNEELLLAVQGVRKYGKDFKAIAEVIGNKTESLCRSFFVNYRRRYNLDEVLAEYEKEHGKQDISKEAEKDESAMEVDGNTENGSGSSAAAAVAVPASSAGASIVQTVSSASESIVSAPSSSANCELLSANAISLDLAAQTVPTSDRTSSVAPASMHTN